MYLLDVNLLVALAWPNHVMHEKAQAWLGTLGDQTWATNSLTEIGFVRLSMNPAVVGRPLSWSGSLEVLQQIRSVPGHRFLGGGETLDILQSDVVGQAPVAGHRQVTDVYLAALAHHHHHQLATLDPGLVQGLHPRHRHLIKVVGPTTGE